MGKVTYYFLALAMLLSTALIGACGGGYGSSYNSSPSSMTGAISTISITPTTASVAKGATQQYMATAKDSNGNVIAGVNFTWASSAGSVATVNSSGLVTAVADGSAMITASFTYSGGIYTTPLTITSNSATLSITGSVSGTAATGRAVAHGTVSLQDARDQFTGTTTDETGHFVLPVSGMTAPFLLKLDDGQGHVLYGLAMSVGTANIDPYTDLLARRLFAGKSTPEAVFAASAGQPAAGVDVQAADAAMVSSLGMPLAQHGIDPASFSLLTTPFEADHTGFDAVLDDSRVDAASGRFTVGNGPGAMTLSRDAATGMIRAEASALAMRPAPYL